MANQIRHNGIFVDCARPGIEHEGVLFLEKGKLPVIEIRDRYRQFGALLLGPGITDHVEKLVGQLAKGHYILATDLHVETVDYPSVGPYNTARLTVYGDLVHSSDELLWNDQDALASVLYVQMDRLEDWALPPLRIAAPGRYPPEWFAMGLSLLPHSPRTISISRGESPDVVVELPNGLRLRFRSQLSYGSGDGDDGPRHHSAIAHQHALLVVDAIGESQPARKNPESSPPDARQANASPVWGLVTAASEFRKLLRFVYDDNCRIRSMLATREDRNRDLRSDDLIFDDPVPHVHSIHCQQSAQPLGPSKFPLFRLHDIAGRPVIEKWYELDRYHRDVLDEMADGTSQLYCASIAASLIGEYGKRLDNYEKEKQFELLMADLELEKWGVDTTRWGQRISLLRNDPMHGRANSLEPHELEDTCRVVIQLIKILTLRELGFSLEETGQMIKGRRWTLAPSEG